MAQPEICTEQRIKSISACGYVNVYTFKLGGMSIDVYVSINVYVFVLFSVNWDTLELLPDKTYL